MNELEDCTFKPSLVVSCTNSKFEDETDQGNENQIGVSLELLNY